MPRCEIKARRGRQPADLCYAVRAPPCYDAAVAPGQDDGRAAMTPVDTALRPLLEAERFMEATTLVLRTLGPEILGFLSAVLGNVDGDEVFAAFSESLWRSLPAYRSKCAIRTWAYMLARQQIARHRKGARRHPQQVRISELADVLQEVRKTYTTRRATLTRLRNELSIEDRELLILRIDRELSFDEIALLFVDDASTADEQTLHREAARLRKRFQLIKDQLMTRVREIQAWP
jgi:RNA polymerase sigma-70 factor (ECF subfamily)